MANKMCMCNTYTYKFKYILSNCNILSTYLITGLLIWHYQFFFKYQCPLILSFICFICKLKFHFFLKKFQNVLNQNMGTHQILRILTIEIYWTFVCLECAYNFNASTFFIFFWREGNAIEDSCTRQWWMQNGQEHVKSRH